jgi:hypothetical protein
MSAEYVPASFDPLSTEQISNTICETFEWQPLVSMTHGLPRFEGAGLYAIYYRGRSVELYRPLNDLQIPVYVGRAHSSNSATGETLREQYPLYKRLRQHRTSIIEGGLPINELRFRALLLPDVHTDLGENGMRVGYRPVWNSKLPGFGGHEQGAKTRQGMKSKWDTVHDGRRRTHGGVVHSVELLTGEVRAHVQRQVADYVHMPWPHPAKDKYLELDAM